jgi:hypothetical protein
MPPEMQNMLLTGGFILILLVLFIWLIRALMPGTKEEARRAARDEYEIAGYETMDQIRRKEYSVIGLTTFVVLLCAAIMAGLGYLLWTSDFSSTPGDQTGMNTILVFVPTTVLLLMIIISSRRYIKHQQGVLKEYRVFRSKREKAIKEYEAKRSGKEKDEKQQVHRGRHSKTQRGTTTQQVRKKRRRGPPKR